MRNKFIQPALKTKSLDAVGCEVASKANGVLTIASADVAPCAFHKGTRVCLLGSIIAAIFCYTSLYAENIALWTEALPGFRKPMDVSMLPDKVFGLKVENESKAQSSDADTSALVNEIISKIKGLPVTGLVWGSKSDDRRVLLGDIVMREGQAIPAYVFGDGKYYVLMEITKTRLRFKMQDGDLSNSVVFDVPFGLKDTLKNESEFSSSPAKDSVKNAKK